MKCSYLIWLNWPERPFRLCAADLRLFKSLVAAGSAVKAVWSERAFLRELPSATHAICWEFRREWFAKARRLRVLATPGAGRELLPGDGELPAGVRKYHGEFHGDIMSETVVAYMLAWCRGLYPAYDWQRSGDDADLWRRVALGERCFMLAGTKAAILGYGHVGRAVGGKLKALGVEVRGIRRRNIAELPDAAAWADWLICVLPSDTGTDDIVDAKLLRRMKRSAVLINVGRGNAVDERALACALKRREISAAFLDVFKREPLTAASPLASDMPGLFRLPHSSAFSPDYLARFFRELAGRGALGICGKKGKSPRQRPASGRGVRGGTR